MKTLKTKYSQRKPVGSYAICNIAGFLFYEPLEEDRPDCDFVVAMPCDDKVDGFRKTVVKYNTDGKPYIKRNGGKIYLSEVMRV